MGESIVGGDEDAVRPEPGPTLSVVVITHNERERIGACLESVFAAAEPLDRVEVVLVDSRSTDGTLDVARDHPITILRLPPEPTVTPSAGRYVGTAATSGDLILFVDGDMILADGWLRGACRRVRTDSALAGVDGHLDEPGGEDDDPVDVLRGVALYDRRALDDVGGFDPFLQSMEDIDLSYRLDAAGYDLLRLAAVVASHPAPTPESERRRRWRRGYYHGRGQLFRKYLTRPRLFARLVYRTRLYLAPLVWSSLAPVAGRTGGKRGVGAWTLATVLGFVAASRLRGLDWTVDKLVASGPVLGGIVLGLPLTWPSPSAYPLDDVETIQRASPTSAIEAGSRT